MSILTGRLRDQGATGLMHGAELGLGESVIWVVGLQRRVESIPLARPGVEAQGDLVEIVLAVDRQVRSLGQVLAQQAVSSKAWSWRLLRLWVGAVAVLLVPLLPL